MLNYEDNENTSYGPKVNGLFMNIVCIMLVLPISSVVLSVLFIFMFLLCILINPLTPNDTYSGRTAPLTSKRFILHIYSTNVGTEYFKHGV